MDRLLVGSTVCWMLGLGALAGCGSVVTMAPGTATDASTDGGAVTDAPSLDVPAACGIDCASPPPGCRYVGGARCSCGTLVCDDAGIHDTGTPDVATSDAGAPDTGVVCGGSREGSFPAFASACSVASDCVLAVHQTDCCGNTHALGIRADQQAAFTLAEQQCDRMYPGCGCPAGPTVADDGMSARPPATIAVQCTSGMCTTYVTH